MIEMYIIFHIIFLNGFLPMERGEETGLRFKGMAFSIT